MLSYLEELFQSFFFFFSLSTKHSETDVFLRKESVCVKTVTVEGRVPEWGQVVMMHLPNIFSSKKLKTTCCAQPASIKHFEHFTDDVLNQRGHFSQKKKHSLIKSDLLLGCWSAWPWTDSLITRPSCCLTLRISQSTQLVSSRVATCVTSLALTAHVVSL